MAQENVGTIYYDVVGDTSKLVNTTTAGTDALDKLGASMKGADRAQAGLQTNLTKTAAAVQSLGKEAQSTGGILDGLNGLFAGLVTGATVLNLITMAEAYGEMSERIQMATKDATEYEMVQARLIKTANAIYRPLKEAQETYVLTSDALRSMGYDTTQALDITDSLSLSFVKNATSADRAQSAISAFTKSIQKGNVEGDAWESLLAAVPSVIQDIATASGKTTAEIREMGVNGKISAQMLSEGLRQSLDANTAAAAGMSTTMKDAINNITNNLSVFLGEANKATGATGILSSALLAFGNNIATVATALGALGAGALARYIGQTAASVASNTLAALAAREQAVAEVNKAQALVASTAATLANAQATQGLIASNVSATAAAVAHANAQKALQVAQAGVTSVGQGLLAFLGGPAGIVAMLAAGAAAAYLFSDSNKIAQVSLDGFAVSTEAAAEKLRMMGAAQQEIVKLAAAEKIKTSFDDLKAAADKFAAGPITMSSAGVEWTAQYARAIYDTVKAVNDGTKSYEDMNKELTALVTTYGTAQNMSQRWIAGQLDNVKAMVDAAKAGADAKNSLVNITNAMYDANSAANLAASGVNNLGGALAALSGGEAKALAALDKSLATFGKTGAAGNIYDIQQGIKGIGDMAGFSKPVLDKLLAGYTELEKKQIDAQKRGGGGGRSSAKAENAQAKALADVENQIEAFGKSGTEHKLYTIEQGLRGIGSMAKFSKGTLAELKAQYEKLAEMEKNKKESDAAKAYITQLQESADAVDKMTTSERLQYDIVAGKVVLRGEELTKATALAQTIDARTKKEKELADAMSLQSAELSTQRKLQAELLKYAIAIDGAMLGDDARAQMEERAQIAQDFSARIEKIQDARREAIAKAGAKAGQEELDRINKLYDDQLGVEETFQAKSLAAWMAHNEKKKQLDEDWRVGAFKSLNNYQESAKKTASQAETAFTNFLKGTEDMLVEFVKTGKLSFASLADSIISDIARIAAKTLTSGIASWLGSAIGDYFGVPGAGKTGAASSGATIPGRANGGPVKSGTMYRVNERGTPELLNVGGNQYLMMGNKSGSVDNMGGNAGVATGGGSVQVLVNVTNNTDSRVTTNERQSGNGKIIDIVIEAVAADVMNGGRVASSMQNAYGLNRGAGTPRFVR